MLAIWDFYIREIAHVYVCGAVEAVWLHDWLFLSHYNIVCTPEPSLSVVVVTIIIPVINECQTALNTGS